MRFAVVSAPGVILSPFLPALVTGIIEGVVTSSWRESLPSRGLRIEIQWNDSDFLSRKAQHNTRLPPRTHLLRRGIVDCVSACFDQLADAFDTILPFGP